MTNLYNRLGYYLRRIGEASPLSIALIFYYKLKKRIYFFYYSFFPKMFNNKNYFKNIVGYSKNFLQDYNINNAQTDIKFSNEKLANLILNNQFICLGYGNIKIPKENDWHKDTFHHYSWDLKYFNNIDFICDNKYCDVKVPWELSRLQFIVVLALSYVEKKDYKILNQYNTIIDDWIKSNPAGYGINWTCTMEVSIRSINLIISYMLLYEFLSIDIKNKIENSILEHNHYIKSFPEISDIPGNHYLSNLMGLYINNYIILGKENKITLQSLKNFIDEAQKQFLSDGCHFEMSTIYHRLCMEMLSLVIAMSYEIKDSKKVFNQSLLNIYNQGLEFCNKISSKDLLPIFGDTDSGHILWLGSHSRDFTYLEQFYNIIINKPYYKTIQHNTILLSSLANIKIPKQNLILKDYPDISSHNNSGYISCKNSGMSAVMRVGEQGLGGRAPHDHDDALHIWLSYQGKDILVDEGSHSYTLDRLIREKYILSSAHNVLKPKNKERYESVTGSITKTIRGAHIADNIYHKKDKKIDSSSIKASLRIDKNCDFIYSNRKVQIDNNLNVLKTLIIDNWELKNRNLSEINWRFGKGFIPRIVNKKDSYVKLIFENDERFSMKISCDSNIAIELFNYNFSPVYGLLYDCKGINITMKTKKGIIRTELNLNLADKKQ